MPTKIKKEKIEKIRTLRSEENPVSYIEVANIVGVSVGTAHKYGRAAASPVTVVTDAFSRAHPPVLLGGQTMNYDTGSIPPLTFDPYDREILRKLHKYDEPQLYTLYKKEWLTNPFVSLLTEFILNEVFGDGFHFEGEGAEDVETFFKQDKTRKKLKASVREAVLYGNGFLSMDIEGDELRRTKTIPASTISITMDENGDRNYTQTLQSRDKNAILITDTFRVNAEFLTHFMIKELSDVPYGISLLRPNMHFLRALNDVGIDIPAAIKRAAYSPIVAELDLEAFQDDAAKKAAVEEYTKKLNQIVSATTNYAIDARHRLRLLSEGGAGAQQLRVTQLIEPILAVVLLNMGMPIGFFMQAASNRAVLREQREGIQRFISEIKFDIALEVEQEIIPRITDKETVLVWTVAFSDWVRKARTLSTMYQLGILSREYVLDSLDIIDEGEQFIMEPGTASTDGVPRPNPLRDEENEVTD